MESIRKVSDEQWWRHCPGLENPADLASRGAPALALVSSKLWWKGPPWLEEEEGSWPDPPDADEQESDVKKTIEGESKRTSPSITVSVAVVIPGDQIMWDLDRISTWNRLVRRQVWIKRFIKNCKQGRDPDEGFKESITINGKSIEIARMSPKELDKAELLIFRQLQRERYPKVYEALKTGSAIHPKEEVAKLLPIWDQRDGIVRIGGRVSLALRDLEIEPPILLPANHKIVSFLILDRHVRLKHAGVKTTEGEVLDRQRATAG